MTKVHSFVTFFVIFAIKCKKNILFVEKSCIFEKFFVSLRDFSFFNACMCMKYRTKYVILAMLLSMGVSSIRAVSPVPVPYLFGFEDSESAELSEWVMNPGANASLCKDQWHVGESAHNTGKKSLYISDDGGANVHFGDKPNVQYAYRDFTIAAGQYDVTFDYMCQGESNKIFLAAGVTFANAIQSDMVAKNQYANVPNVILSACQLKNLYDASRWKNQSFSFTAKSSDVVLRLFFVWSNNNVDSARYMPLGAGIDNIQITSRNCTKPYDVKALISNDSVLVSWEGTSENYSFERRRHGSDQWYKYSGLTKKEILLEGLAEGAWDFRVRGICNDVDTSAYAYLNSFIVYYPERHCVDFVHLSGDNIHGTIGTFKDPYAISDTIVDFGDDVRSRQTVILDPDKHDPRTCNQLLMVPDGEWASIRLGNWGVGSQAESMSFDIDVTESSALLLVKYAVVMQDPNHGEKDQPRFRLEILDEYGSLIDPSCGKADFFADIKRPGWHQCGDVTWKDWTTLGLNLWDLGLAGQTVTVRFTTYDCNWGGHYGYAYFTLDCAGAKITGTSCGSDTIMNIEAPMGFDYVWYNKYDEEVSRSLSLSIPASDTTTYRCHLSYKESPDCGFDLYGANKPRYPYADFAWEWVPSNCENKIRFTNKSHVYIKVDDVIEHTSEPCEEYQWLVGDVESPDANPVIRVPNAGGDIRVRLAASIANGRCEDDKDTIIHIPSIGDTTIVLDSAICRGDYFIIGDKLSDNMYYAADSGQYVVTWIARSGCDSTMILNLDVRPTSEAYIGDTTVCAEIPLVVDEQLYHPNEQGKYYRFYHNQFGCDSIVWMNVTVLDSIKPLIRVQEMTDAPNSGAIYISGEGFDYYTINDGEPLPWSENMDITGLNGGVFALAFFNEFGCTVEDTISVSKCLVGHVYQRWDNVLSLKDSAAVGDTTLYQFTDFQWYCDEVAIEGANLSYLYVEEGLKAGSAYTLEMTRVSTGERVQTCPFVPKAATEQNRVVIYPSPVHTGGKLTIKSSLPGSVKICNMLGDTAVSAELVAGENYVTAPASAGVYVVQVATENEIQSCQISVIE